MDLNQTFIPKSGRVRRVFPFDLLDLGKYFDPHFWIEVKEENLSDVARRWDAHKFRPGSDKESQAKAIMVGQKSIIDTIVGWGRECEDVANCPTCKGRPPLENKGQEVPCDSRGKVAYAEAMIPRGEEWVSLWGLTVEALDRQKREELGNATSSSPTTSAAV